MQAAIELTEAINPKELKLDLDFSINFNQRKIASFREFLIKTTNSSLIPLQEKASKEVDFPNRKSKDKKENKGNFKIKIEDCERIEKTISKLSKFLSDTLKDYSKVKYETPEYVELSNRINELEKSRDLAKKHRNFGKTKELKTNIETLDQKRNSIKDEQYRNFREQKIKDFNYLRQKLWKLWEEIISHLKYNQKRIEFKTIDLEQNIRQNQKEISDLSSQKDEIINKINELNGIYRKYKDPKKLIELSDDREVVLSTLKDYRNSLKKEKLKGLKVIKEKKVQKKKKPKKKTQKDSKNSRISIIREIISSALLSSKILTKLLDVNVYKRSIQLTLDTKKIYETFCSYLTTVSNEQFSIEEPYSFKGSYLMTNYPIQQLNEILNGNPLYKDGIIKTSKVGLFSGIRIDFIKLIEVLWNKFLKEKSPFKPLRLRNLFHKISNLNLPTKKAIIATFIFTTVLLLAFSTLIITIPKIPHSNSNIIEKYDEVQIDYQYWESNENEDYDIFNPLFDEIVWVNMVPITENSTNGLILGLYSHLLGKKLHYESDLIWLNRCIDQDRNGIDDITRAPALTFGNSSDQYFNTCLMIQFKVLNFNKAPEPDQTRFMQITSLCGLVIFGDVILYLIIIITIIKQNKKNTTRSTRQTKI